MAQAEARGFGIIAKHLGTANLTIVIPSGARNLGSWGVGLSPDSSPASGGFGMTFWAYIMSGRTSPTGLNAENRKTLEGGPTEGKPAGHGGILMLSQRRGRSATVKDVEPRLVGAARKHRQL
jgi:hypothetical protein